MGKLFSKNKGDNERYIKNESRLSAMKSATSDLDSCSNVSRKIVNCFPFDNVLYTSVGPSNICLFGVYDYTLKAFDYVNGKVTNEWRGHENDITKTVYCKKIDAYLSGSRDKSIKLWNTKSNKCLTNMTGHELVVNGLGIDSKNTHVISGSRDNSLRLWDLNTGKMLLTTNISRNLITDVFWSSDDRILMQSSEDKEIRLWDPYTLKLIFSFPKKQYIQTSCHLSNDGFYALSSSNGFQGNGCEVTVWDLRKRAILHELLGHTQTVSCAKFIQSDRKIVSVGHDSALKIWDVNRAKNVEFSLHIPGTLTSVNESIHDGTLIVTSLNNGIFVVK